MKIPTRIILIAIATAFLLKSCDKPSYPEDSILGTWRCFEEGSVSGYRQYNVSIDYEGTDSTMIKILNFYNLGFQVETYATVSDTLIEFIGTNTFDDFSGTGHIERDFSAIYWRFSYSGYSGSDPQVEAAFRRF
jgi:hypothetical protein